MRTVGAKGKRARRSPHDTPDAKVLRTMGYVTPAEAAKLARAAPTTIYGWLARGALLDQGKLKASCRMNGVLWILKASVLKLRPNPAELARR